MKQLCFACQNVHSQYQTDNQSVNQSINHTNQIRSAQQGEINLVQLARSDKVSPGMSSRVNRARSDQVSPARSDQTKSS